MTEFETHQRVEAESSDDYRRVVDEWAVPFLRRHLPDADFSEPINYGQLFSDLRLKGIQTEFVQSPLVIGQPQEMVYRFLSGEIVLKELKIKLKFEN